MSEWSHCIMFHAGEPKPPCCMEKLSSVILSLCAYVRRSDWLQKRDSEPSLSTRVWEATQFLLKRSVLSSTPTLSSQGHRVLSPRALHTRTLPSHCHYHTFMWIETVIETRSLKVWCLKCRKRLIIVPLRRQSALFERV